MGRFHLFKESLTLSHYLELEVVYLSYHNADLPLHNCALKAERVWACVGPAVYSYVN